MALDSELPPEKDPPEEIDSGPELFIEEPCPPDRFTIASSFLESLTLDGVPQDSCGLFDEQPQPRAIPATPVTVPSIINELNNSLTVLFGYAQRIRNRMSENNALYAEVQSLWDATERVAMFATQLTQIVQPHPAPLPLEARARLKFTPSTETILLVDDDLQLIQLLSSVLPTIGYTLLTASTLGEASRHCRLHSGPIHLLLTDVELEGRVLGPRWVRDLALLKPRMRILYMTGIPEPEKVLLPSDIFIRKPFTLNELARKLRVLLDALPGDSGSA